ncbi:hypothetical protein I7I50_06187 [Histoplasma capsulatum G186AR]|uniref:Uncharacterized protein n=1 Tax=Ajellomyces capsulatus TaxID=5037 RepID=A0A8H7YZS8_AJECA|nr:hypothetical protein I7I52_10735 [Histoplasma capsulatum]QSS67183.1 hypothetical protein I7I50_06187 [Histoplasma capsulatum G186AR]
MSPSGLCRRANRPRSSTPQCTPIGQWAWSGPRCCFCGRLVPHPGLRPQPLGSLPCDG